MYLSNFNPTIYELEPNNGEVIVHVNVTNQPWNYTAEFADDKVTIYGDLRMNVDVSNADIDNDAKVLQTIVTNTSADLKRVGHNFTATVAADKFTEAVNAMTVAMISYQSYHLLQDN